MGRHTFVFAGIHGVVGCVFTKKKKQRVKLLLTEQLLLDQDVEHGLLPDPLDVCHAAQPSSRSSFGLAGNLRRCCAWSDPLLYVLRDWSRYGALGAVAAAGIVLVALALAISSSESAPKQTVV